MCIPDSSASNANPCMPAGTPSQHIGGLQQAALILFLLCAHMLQVHSAVLAGSKKEVVIKVLRPGTEDVLLTDLNFVSLQPSVCCCFQRGLAQAAYPYVCAAARIASLWVI